MIHEYVKNKGLLSSPCEKVVGSVNAVSLLGKFFSSNADLFQIMAIHAQAEWLGVDGSGAFNSNENRAFKQGLSAFPDFMQKCYEEGLQKIADGDSV